MYKIKDTWVKVSIPLVDTLEAVVTCREEVGNAKTVATRNKSTI